MNLTNISGESHIISSGIHHLNEYIVRDNISVASCQSLCFVLNAACVHDIQIYKDTRCSALKRLRQTSTYAPSSATGSVSPRPLFAPPATKSPLYLPHLARLALRRRAEPNH